MTGSRPRLVRLTPPAAAAALAAALLALTACDAQPSVPAEAKGAAGPPVVAPGKPGEPARTLSPEEAAKATPDDSPNAADFSYARMMIIHHAQALTMTGLVPDRATSPQVKKVAERIAAAQKPEIGAMEAWLENNGGDRRQDTGRGHDHGLMPGMATQAQLEQLRAARGTVFDELFLKLMITHHQGAVTMAAEVLSEGNNVLIEEMAADVIAQQTSEINRMRAM
ncbi:DUF305 domain-containing protein [Streptomyces sp. MUM 178J]|uniref:DUF305 domain-containing protein n=1 Tax=Streptomyces sp. MUM 178J TaxID=2791991 RepID=UPI001F039A39|nr:DUF305 domain-containing protein [Streptomyces sp. MUM 178J]WRQ78236.1 DUF305 domain-containing protein [Streptomyces sp. MUM 178J]